MQDIADYLGVSKVTVSKALRGHSDLSAAMCGNVKEAAEKMGYVYQTTSKVPKAPLFRTIVVLTSTRYFGQDDSFYVELYRLLSAQLEARGYLTVLHILNEQAEQSQTIPQILTDRKADGVIFLGQLSRTYIQKFCQLHLPFVFLDFYYDCFQTDCIITDNFFGAYEVTNLLIANCHRDIGFFGNINLTSSIQDRYLGYYKSLLEHGVQINPQWILRDQGDDGVWLETELPEKLPTAFVCHCDKAARGLISLFRRRGIQVPENCSVVGFDDSPDAIQKQPRLTTVHVHLEEMAALTARRIVKRMQGGGLKYGRILVKGDVVLRDSVRRASLSPAYVEKG